MITEFQEGIKLGKHKKVQSSKPLVQSKVQQQKTSVPSFGSYLDGSDNPSQIK